MNVLKISDVIQAFDKGRKKGREEGYNKAIKDVKEMLRKTYKHYNEDYIMKKVEQLKKEAGE